jgi:hypothetical protein
MFYMHQVECRFQETLLKEMLWREWLGGLSF